MVSTYVNDLRLEEMGTGENSGTWGTKTNTNLELIAEAFSMGTENLGSDANTTITVADGTSDEARSFYLKFGLLKMRLLVVSQYQLTRGPGQKLQFQMAG